MATRRIQLSREAQYFKDFIHLNKDQDLVDALFRTNDPAKEITEVVASFWSVVNHLQAFNLSREQDIKIYVLGDGSYPVVGSLLAQHGGWSVVSIDPRMRNISKPRLQTFRGLSSEYAYPTSESAIIVGMHSHAPLSDIEFIPAENKMISWCPCCFGTICKYKTVFNYKDPSLLSEKNEFYIMGNQ